jgi:hypothetical protein
MGDHGAAAEYLALAAAMRPDSAHYTEALRSVRATLRAREQAREPAEPPEPDGADSATEGSATEGSAAENSAAENSATEGGAE